MKLQEYLLGQQTQHTLPLWLKDYCPDDEITWFDVLKSPHVFYPGSGFDGQPIKLFNQSHFVHVYIYVDYMVTKEAIQEDIVKRGYKGYRLLGRTEASRQALLGSSLPPVIDFSEKRKELFVHPFTNVTFGEGQSSTPFYGFLDVYERLPDYDDTHGAQRFAVLYLGEDAFVAFLALYGTRQFRPKVLMVVDHAFGGNYDRFGQKGLLEKIALRRKIMVPYLLCWGHTAVWRGFEEVKGFDPIPKNGYPGFYYWYEHPAIVKKKFFDAFDMFFPRSKKTDKHDA